MDISQFRALAEKANQVVIANIKRDEDYDDAPEEFIGKNRNFRQWSGFLNYCIIEIFRSHDV